MPDLRTLAARVMALTGPDREIDAEIAAKLKIGNNLPDWARNWAGEWRPSAGGYVVLWHDDGSPGPNFKSLAYTASIDAAMTLARNRDEAKNLLKSAMQEIESFGGDDTQQRLARLITAAALLARSEA